MARLSVSLGTLGIRRDNNNTYPATQSLETRHSIIQQVSITPYSTFQSTDYPRLGTAYLYCTCRLKDGVAFARMNFGMNYCPVLT